MTEHLERENEETEVKQKRFFQKFFTKRTLIVMVFSVLALGTYYYFNHITPHYMPAPLYENRLVDMVKKNEVESVISEGKKIIIHTVDGKTLTFLLGENETLHSTLIKGGVSQESWNQLRRENKPSKTDKLIQYLLVVAAIGGLIWFMFLAYTGYMLFRGRKHFSAQGMSDRMKDMLGVKTQATQFTISPKKIENVTFDDIGGQNEAVEKVKIVVDSLKNPHKYQQMGAEPRDGILLTGPPGTGKTLLAEAIAHEAGVPFFHLSGAAFAQMFVGVGPARVRDTFEKARKHAPCIVFIDELDSIGRKRSHITGSGGDEKDDTLNQLLTEMSGLKKHGTAHVILIGATNRVDVLDEALIRKGRFGMRILMPAPDLNGREAILKIHRKRKNMPLAGNVNLRDIASITTGLTGADLEAIVKEAAMQSVYYGRKMITATDLKRAVTETFIGTEVKSKILSDEEKRYIAYHEAGHALCSKETVQRVSIIPSIFSLGHTLHAPEKEEYTVTKTRIMDILRCAYGGRAAEMVVYGRNGTTQHSLDKVTSGAKSDIPRATEIIRQMIEEWGLSESIGPIGYKTQQSSNPLIPVLSTQHSEETKREIDLEVKRMAERILQEAVDHLTKNKPVLERFAEELLRKETLEKEEIQEIMKDLK